MIGLDRLLDRPCVLAAGQFSKNGEMLRGVGKLDKNQMEEVAGICAKAEVAFKKLVGDLDEATDMPWRSLTGWIVMGENLALFVMDHGGVIVDSTKADFNRLLVDLFGPTAGEVPVP